MLRIALTARRPSLAAMRIAPVALAMSARLAAGVAHKDTFPLADDKVDRAFAKGDQIKPGIAKWCTTGGEPPQLLVNRELFSRARTDACLAQSIEAHPSRCLGTALI